MAARHGELPAPRESIDFFIKLQYSLQVNSFLSLKNWYSHQKLDKTAAGTRSCPLAGYSDKAIYRVSPKNVHIYLTLIKAFDIFTGLDRID